MIFIALILNYKTSKFYSAVRQACAVPIRGADKFERNKILKVRKRAPLWIASLRRAARSANLAPQNARATSGKI